METARLIEIADKVALELKKDFANGERYGFRAIMRMVMSEMGVPDEAWSDIYRDVASLLGGRNKHPRTAPASAEEEIIEIWFTDDGSPIDYVVSPFGPRTILVSVRNSCGELELRYVRQEGGLRLSQSDVTMEVPPHVLAQAERTAKAHLAFLFPVPA